MRYLFDGWLFISFVVLVGALIFMASYYLGSTDEIVVAVSQDDTVIAEPPSEAGLEAARLCEQLENCNGF